MKITTSHACPPWTVRAWPALLWQAEELPRLKLQHMGTRVTHPADPTSCVAGQTLWASSTPLVGQAGMAWDWVHLACGVVAMADPLSVVTNLRLINADGDGLTLLETFRYLNELVHELDWQQEVERVVTVSEQVA